MFFAFSTSSPSSSFMRSTLSSSSSSYYFKNPPFSNPRNSIAQHIKCIPQLGFTPFAQWNGLKLVGISISRYSVKIERKGKCKKGKGAYASLFGVGAPEVLVIGVVALLVFGPKGLAEVARNLGKTLREFQPTIRELQEVSREFKSTLEREIGLDDIDNPVRKSSSPSTNTKPTSEGKPENSGINIEPNGSSTENSVDSTDNSLQLRADRFKGALAQLQKEQQDEKESEKEKAQNEAESQTPSQETPQALDTSQEYSNSSVTPPSENPDCNAPQETASVVVSTDGNALQETASVVVSKDSASKTETQA